MIGTVTLNTSIDKQYIVNQLSVGDVNRVQECIYTAGGKGVNVSRVARIVGEDVLATGFAGGYAGDYIIQEIEREGIIPFFIRTGGESRSCINLFDAETHCQTELLEPGEYVSEAEQEHLLEHINIMAARCDVIVVSGSAPRGTDTDLYSKMIGIGRKYGKRILLDTSGEMLKNSLGAGPYMIKPNGDEIKTLTGVRPESEEQVREEAKKLQNLGVEMVAVSLGSNGAMVACDEGIYRVRVPRIPAVNTVGCGDAMMAGFATGISRQYDREKTITFAAAVSVANALQKKTGFIDMRDVYRIIPEITIEFIGK